MAGFAVKRFTKGDARQKIEAHVLGQFVKDKGFGMAVLEKKRNQALALERAAFNATLDGITQLISKEKLSLSLERVSTHIGIKTDLQLTVAGKKQEARFSPVLSDLQSIPTSMDVSFYTLPWNPLNEAYRKRKPQSHSFWRKHELGSEGFLLLVKDMKSLVSKRMKAVTLESHTTQRSIKGLFGIELPRLPNQWNFIRDSFLSGRVSAIETASGREGHERLIWPEQDENRPMLRQYSAQMGKEFRDILSRIR